MSHVGFFNYYLHLCFCENIAFKQLFFSKDMLLIHSSSSITLLVISWTEEGAIFTLTYPFWCQINTSSVSRATVLRSRLGNPSHIPCCLATALNVEANVLACFNDPAVALVCVLSRSSN